MRRTSTKKPAAKKPAAKKPAAKKPAAKKPAARKATAKSTTVRGKPPERTRTASGRPRRRVVAAAVRDPASPSVPPAPPLPVLPAPPPPPPPPPPWREALRVALATTGEHFATYLRGLRAGGWEHADTPELAGLEQWGTELTARDRLTGIGALVRAAQYGVELAIAAGGIGLEGMGFAASEPVAEGAPVAKQLALAAAWLDAPDAAHLAAVAAGTDRSRRTPIWDDDLRPSDDRAHWWYLDVGQCCCHAILRTGGDPSRPSYDAWDAATCVGRGLVAAVRGLRHKGADLGVLLADIRRAMVAPR